MRSTGLIGYLIKIRQKGDLDAYQTLSRMDGGDDFLDLLIAYYERRKRLVVNRSEQKAFKVVQHYAARRRLSGIINYGVYGTIEEIIHIETDSSVFTKDKDHSPLWPFYYRAVVPTDSEVGLLILETSGSRRVKGAIEADLNEFLDREAPDLVMELSPLFPSELLNLYLDYGRISQLKFVGYKIPGDKFSAIRGFPHSQSIEADLVIREFDYENVRRKVRDIIKGGKGASSFISIDGADYEDVSIVFKMGSKQKVISLENPYARGGVYDITLHEDIEWNAQEHPTFDSVDKIAAAFTEVLLNGVVKSGSYSDV